MRCPRIHPVVLALAAAVSLVLAGTAAAASPGVTGGGASFSKAQGGGARYGTTAQRVDVRPGLAVLDVDPQTLRAGRMPEVRFRIAQRGTSEVRVRLAVVRLRDRKPVLRMGLGMRRTGRTIAVKWPKRARLTPGRYTVLLQATDMVGHTLRGRAKGAKQAVIVVRPKPKPKPKPKHERRPKVHPNPDPTPTVPPRRAGVFPVRGWFTYGSDGSRFGAGRKGHIHQGQDVAAASGTPIVAPTAGTVTAVSFQRGGAGYYVVMTSVDGRDFFFAHLQAGSIVVSVGQAVSAGMQLGAVGSTGSSSGPHLHFEIWEGGWQRGRPVDPLAQLRAWAQ